MVLFYFEARFLCVALAVLELSLLQEVREMTPFVRWELATQVPGECRLYLTARNPSVVQVELMSRYLDCLLEMGNWNFFGLDSLRLRNLPASECWDKGTCYHIQQVQCVLQYAFN